jgi:SAM-dependent methyltransferase
MPPSSSRDRFLELLRAAVQEGTLAKVTLGKYRGGDPSVKNLFVRPVALKAGPQFAFVWRHATRDITKNHSAPEALRELARLIGADFLDAHLFTATESAQLETKSDGSARLKIKPAALGVAKSVASQSHDRTKSHLIPADAAWLRALGVTNERGQPREGMTDKFRQIQKFAELLSHLLDEAFPDWRQPRDASPPLQIVDMGSGKGYLTFALAAVLGDRAQIRGVELRPELVGLCNRIAAESGLGSRVKFSAGAIADTPLTACDVLIALHACDTATDDALARGISAGARLLVVAPCCQKELRSQLRAPAVLADALRHGIFQERQAEFVTDALRAQLLEWAGHRTKVFEFISTEHTAKNLMIAAIRNSAERDRALAERTREFARFYGVRDQRLARHLGFGFSPGT